MKNERWDEIEQLFDEALEHPEDERKTWLRAACGDDPKIYNEVETMLEAHLKAGNFLEQAAIEVAPDLLPLTEENFDTLPAEKKIGPYLLLKKLGSGGMGTVYLAEYADKPIERKVALKVLHPFFEQSNFVKRFMQEERLLSTLEHPYISRLYDAGMTDDGTPYFAMEYAGGRSIDRYCEDKELSVDERLQLFIKVCEAVQHAHRNLIVHRDLKPSNVLVDENGAPKLLDFGIAKLLNEGVETTAALTRTGECWMTPEYAAPEQVKGRLISTAADVYALGALLYKLLTGRPPFHCENGATGEMERMICEDDPLLPSEIAAENRQPERLKKKLRGDIDTIILKALRKEPARRYPSVEALIEDINRHLNGIPVKARRDTLGYRVKKFTHRHRFGLAALAAILLLVAGFTTFYIVQITQERDRAEQYAALLTNLFRSPDPYLTTENAGGKDITVREYLGKAAKRVRTELRDDPKMQIALLGTLAEVHKHLGYWDEAHLLYQDLLAQQQRVYGESSPEVIGMMRKLALVTEDGAVADSLYRRQLTLGRAFEAGVGLLTAKSLVAYGNFLYGQGEFKAALKQLEQAVEVFRGAGQEYRQELARALLFSGQVHEGLYHLRQADTLIQEAFSIQKKLTGENHPKTAIYMTHVATINEALGNLDRAEHFKRRSLEIFRNTLGEQHPYTLSALNNLSVLLSGKGDYAEAEKIQRRVLAIRRVQYGKDDKNTIGALQNLATYLLYQGKLDEAEPLLRKAYTLYKQNLPADHHLIAFPLLSLTELYMKRKDFKKAESAARDAVEQLRIALPDNHVYVAIAESMLGAALTGQKQYDKAATLLKRSYKRLQEAQGADKYEKKAFQRLQLLKKEQQAMISLKDK